MLNQLKHLVNWWGGEDIAFLFRNRRISLEEGKVMLNTRVLLKMTIITVLLFALILI